LEGAAAFFNVLALLVWAKAGDIYGRRPAILSGVTGACVVSVLFGFGGSYAWLLLLRGLL
jgi:MFS family permease